MVEDDSGTPRKSREQLSDCDGSQDSGERKIDHSSYTARLRERGCAMILPSAYNPSLDWLCEQEREVSRWREDLIAYSDPDWALIDNLDRHKDWLAGQIDRLNGKPKGGPR